MTSPDRTIMNQLIDFGLTEKEATVYLTAIESGTVTVQQLSKDSGINRSSTYAILDSLLTKGLIGKLENAAGVSTYEAYGPDILLKEVSQMEKKHTEIHKNIDALVPKLNALSSTLALHPIVKFYEGTGGIETATYDLSTVKSGEKVRIFAVEPEVNHRKSGQPTQVIVPHKSGALPESNEKSLSVCFIPAKQYNFSSDIRIYENKIVLISKQEDFAAIIEDQYFAEVMKKTFDLAWEEAKRLDAQIRITA